MKNIICLSVICLILVGYATGQVNSALLQSGQWTAPIHMGNNRYYLKGHGDRDAINGANSSCATIGRNAIIEQLIPSTMRQSAAVTFVCN